MALERVTLTWDGPVVLLHAPHVVLAAHVAPWAVAPPRPEAPLLLLVVVDASSLKSDADAGG